MGNFDATNKEREKAEARKSNRREKLALLSFDFAKIIFSGMVIGIFVPLLNQEFTTEKWLFGVFGIMTTIVCIYTGNKLLK